MRNNGGSWCIDIFIVSDFMLIFFLFPDRVSIDVTIFCFLRSSIKTAFIHDHEKRRVLFLESYFFRFFKSFCFYRRCLPVSHLKAIYLFLSDFTVCGIAGHCLLVYFCCCFFCLELVILSFIFFSPLLWKVEQLEKTFSMFISWDYRVWRGMKSVSRNKLAAPAIWDGKSLQKPLGDRWRVGFMRQFREQISETE